MEKKEREGEKKKERGEKKRKKEREKGEPDGHHCSSLSELKELGGFTRHSQASR